MATISSYFGATSARRPDSDRVILAPAYISPRPNDPAGILIEPDEFALNGKQYVRYSVVAKSQKHTKKRILVIWQYGEDIQLKQDPTKKFWETGEHRPTKNDPLQPSIVNFNSISTVIFKRRFDEFKELLIRWIVYCYIAFFQIENLYFRNLLFYIFPGLTTLLPKASLMISPNYQATLGCIAHFVNRSGKRRTAVLALCKLVGEHSKENIADALLYIFGDYGISSRISYFMADNTTLNDAYINLVL
ncbi:HAT domain-containing protein [Ilyonectria robusta]